MSWYNQVVKCSDGTASARNSDCTTGPTQKNACHLWSIYPHADVSYLSKSRTFTTCQQLEDQAPHSLECTESQPISPALQQVVGIHDSQTRIVYYKTHQCTSTDSRRGRKPMKSNTVLISSTSLNINGRYPQKNITEA